MWFDALKRNKDFNIELIEEELLCSIAEELNNSIQEHNTEQVRHCSSSSSQPLLIAISPFFPLLFITNQHLAKLPLSPPAVVIAVHLLPPFAVCHLPPAAVIPRLPVYHLLLPPSICHLLPTDHHLPTCYHMCIATPPLTTPHITNIATSQHCS